MAMVICPFFPLAYSHAHGVVFPAGDDFDQGLALKNIDFGTYVSDT